MYWKNRTYGHSATLPFATYSLLPTTYLLGRYLLPSYLPTYLPTATYRLLPTDLPTVGAKIFKKGLGAHKWKSLGSEMWNWAWYLSWEGNNVKGPLTSASPETDLIGDNEAKWCGPLSSNVSLAVAVAKASQKKLLFTSGTLIKTGTAHCQLDNASDPAGHTQP